jgi:hypothetical protein
MAAVCVGPVVNRGRGLHAWNQLPVLRERDVLEQLALAPGVWMGQDDRPRPRSNAGRVLRAGCGQSIGGLIHSLVWITARNGRLALARVAN